MLTGSECTCSKTGESFSAYNFAMLPVFLLDACGTFNSSMSEAGATRQHQTSSAWASSRAHARRGLKSHCSERMWFREACVRQGEGHHQHVAQVSPTAASEVCLEQADLMQSLPSSPSHSCTSRFWARFPWTRQLQGPHSAADIKDGCLPPAQLSPLWLCPSL